MRSEAVYLDLVSADARCGLIVRLCRHPQEGYSWLWGHVFLDGRVYAFTQHDVPCSTATTRVEDDHAAYRSEGGWSSLAFVREGPLDAIRAVRATGLFEMHESRHAPHGAGALSVAVESGFTPTATAVSNRAGRNEVLGTTSAHVTLGRHVFELAGGGQFHEQVQTDPRFTTPFTYGTLRGSGAGVVFIRGVRGARGHWIEGGTATAIHRIEISPPGSRRRLLLHTADGVRDGELETTYDYSIPIGTGFRPGTLVAGEIGGVALSGCLNDFLLDQLDYDRV